MPPSNHIQTPGTYKFSTFGYKPHDENPIVQEIPMQCYSKRDSSIASNRLESITPSNAGIYSYEHPSKYGTPSPVSSSTPTTATTTMDTPNMRTFNTGSKKNTVKMEQSQLMLEIRNSAPDVIIMTSH